MKLRNRNKPTTSPLPPPGDLYFPELPIEILTLHIIPRLPIKSILQCKSLSKYFNQFISFSTPSFSHIYLNNLSTRPTSFTVLVRKHGSKGSTLDMLEFDKYNLVKENKLRCYNDNDVVSFWGTCNGLICFFQCYNYFFVTNPMFNDIICLDGLGGDKCLLALGLGFCQFTKRYKVLRIFKHKADNKVEIFTVGFDKTWRNGGNDDVPYKLRARYYSGYDNQKSSIVAFGNSLHWLGQPGSVKPPYICVFDMIEEKVCELPLPLDIIAGGRVCKGYLGVLMDKLCLFDEADCLDVWVMTEYGVEGSFMKYFTLKTCILPADYKRSSTKVLALSNEGVIMLSDGCQFVFYDLQANNVMKVIRLANKMHFDPTVIAYVPSFVTLQSLIKGETSNIMKY